MSTDVKFLHSALTGAPSLSGTTGALLAVLDAALVDGWGAGTVDSLVIAGGVATMTRAAGNPFDVGAVADVSGVSSPAGINGQHRVLTRSASTVTFDATGFADQTATGTIVQKAAPLGWSIAFTGTNKRVYRSPNTDGTRLFLRVDDTNTSTAARAARVRGYETMSDVDTGTGPFPTDAQLSGGAYIAKSSTADAAARPWMVTGDDRGFILSVAHTASTPTFFQSYFFGDIKSSAEVDPWAFAINGTTSDISTSASGNGAGELSYSASALWLARPAHGAGGSYAASRAVHVFRTSSAAYSGDSSHLTYPDLAGGLLACAMQVVEVAAVPYHHRGEIPGALFLGQSVGSFLAAGDRVSGSGDLVGHELLVVRTNGAGWALDITGPWR